MVACYAARGGLGVGLRLGRSRASEWVWGWGLGGWVLRFDGGFKSWLLAAQNRRRVSVNFAL